MKNASTLRANNKDLEETPCVLASCSEADGRISMRYKVSGKSYQKSRLLSLVIMRMIALDFTSSAWRKRRRQIFSSSSATLILESDRWTETASEDGDDLKIASNVSSGPYSVLVLQIFVI